MPRFGQDYGASGSSIGSPSRLVGSRARATPVDSAGLPQALEDGDRAPRGDGFDDPQPVLTRTTVENVHIECASQELRPRHTWRRGVEEAAEKTRPMLDTQDVGGDLKL